MTAITFTDTERAALTRIREQAMKEGRIATAQHERRAVATIESRPGPMLYEGVPQWMYELSMNIGEEPIMAIPQRRALLALVILGAAFVGALVLVGIAWRLIHA